MGGSASKEEISKELHDAKHNKVNSYEKQLERDGPPLKFVNPYENSNQACKHTLAALEKCVTEQSGSAMNCLSVMEEHKKCLKSHKV